MRTLSLVVVVVAGCGPASNARLPGAPDAGAPCAAGASHECASDSSLAACGDGRWQDLQCESGATCGASADFCRPAAGQRCAADLEGFSVGNCGGGETVVMCCGGTLKVRHCGGCQEKRNMAGRLVYIECRGDGGLQRCD